MRLVEGMRRRVTGRSRAEGIADVLARARALADDGRHLEAIDLLAERNGAARNTMLETALRDLRYDAFSALDRTAGVDTWPPTTDDLFPDSEGIPEIPAARLDAATLRSGIVRHGALIVRGLLDPTTVARMVEGIDQTLAMAQLARGGASEDETLPWYSAFDPAGKIGNEGGRNFVLNSGGVYTADSPRMLFEVIEMFRQLGIIDAITGHLGERPALSIKKSTLRTVSPDSNTNWHQDGAFLGDGVRSTNVWVALTDCGEHAPTLDLVPRRLHSIVETGTHGAIFDWSVGHDLVERVAGDDGIIRLHFRAGDAILFDEMNLHRTAVSDTMTERRYAIESWFFAPSHYPMNQVPLVI